jgi:signal transduction histidine kinase
MGHSAVGAGDRQGGVYAAALQGGVGRSLTNVMKHARGSHTFVELAYGSTQLTVLVADDGNGPATSPDAGSGGHGLLGMRERVRMFGGSFDAGRGPGGGWIMTAVLPVAADSL